MIKNSGKLTVDILDVASGKTMTVEKNATLTVDGVKLEEGSTLINNGNLTVNREVDDRDGGTLENHVTTKWKWKYTRFCKADTDRNSRF